jgi:hypothetical protein
MTLTDDLDPQNTTIEKEGHNKIIPDHPRTKKRAGRSA